MKALARVAVVLVFAEMVVMVALTPIVPLLAVGIAAMSAVMLGVVLISRRLLSDDRGPHRVCLIPEGCGHHGTRG